MNPGSTLETLRRMAEMRDRVASWRRARTGARVGLVPTMGGIHDGHLALIDAARAACDHVVVSLFVNPTQFGPAEDFDGYPRDAAGDARLIAAAGADVLFAPEAEEVYAPRFATTVSVSGVSQGLCGGYRPGHFDGVSTVVAKLFGQVRPDAAWFGEKDYQQLQVIRRMTEDLDLGVAVESVPTVREADGLAMSSRNRYLTAEERRVAPQLFAILSQAAESIAGGDAAAQCCAAAVAALGEAGFAEIDYVEARDAETLEPVTGTATRPARVLGAVRLGSARLIDNVAVVARR
jgi:pantoate--beta-alanine ligase